MENFLLLLLILAFVGFICWAIVTFVPMPQIFKTVLIALVVFAVLYWVITNYGPLLHLPAPHRVS